MKSAKTIRVCSSIMEVLMIVGAIIGGIAVMVEGEFFILIGMAVSVFGIAIAIFQNAIFQGFADIIDNTYASAAKSNGIEVDSFNDENGQVLFDVKTNTVNNTANKTDNNRFEYANELLKNGWISQEEYNDIISRG